MPVAASSVPALAAIVDLNGHHQKWLGSTTTNRHGVAAFDFATVSSYDQLVIGPTHAHGGTLNLLMTYVYDLVRVAVVAHIGKSDHSCLSAVMFQTCVFVGKFPETSSQLEYSLWCNTGSALA